MILRISRCSSVTKIVGITPTVVPLLGSTSISGIGMKGAVAGFNQRASPCGGAAAAALGAAPMACAAAVSAAGALSDDCALSADCAHAQPAAAGASAIAAARAANTRRLNDAR